MNNFKTKQIYNTFFCNSNTIAKYYFSLLLKTPILKLIKNKKVLKI